MQTDEVTLSKAVSINLRARGARVAAGFLTGADAAKATGVPACWYPHIEGRQQSFNSEQQTHLRSCARWFGVSNGFLEQGLVTQQADAVALRLATVLYHYRSTREGRSDIPARIAEARAAAGFRSPAEAIAAHDWFPLNYPVRERSFASDRPEQALIYALAFSARPEYVLLGEGSLPPQDHEQIDWRPRLF